MSAQLHLVHSRHGSGEFPEALLFQTTRSNWADFPNRVRAGTLAYSEHAGPMDLIAVNGYVLGGRIHAHITMTDDQKAFGGHLHEGTTVFTFAVITLGVLDDHSDLSRFDDSNWR